MRNLISEEIKAIISEVKGLIERLRKASIYIYPCGKYAEELISKLYSELGIIVDNKNMLSNYEEVYNKSCANKQYNEFFVFLANPQRDDWIVDLWNLEGKGILSAKIITPDQLGSITSIINNNDIIRQPFNLREPESSDTIVEKHYKYEANTIIDNLDRCEAAYQILQDEHSKSVFIRILANRLLKCGFYNHIYSEGQYFLDNFLSKSSKEVYVDVGAYNGDTVMGFVKKCPDYKAIYAFEPDTTSFLELIKNTVEAQNISLINAGLYNTNCSMPFKKVKYGSSHIKGIFDWDDPSDESERQAFIKGDDLGLNPSFIKMDIEGSELLALQGLSRTISKYHPKLAICVYHQPNDIWEIPLFIHSINHNYEIYLRHHSQETTETVCYAK